MPTARGGTGAAALHGKILVVGGEGNRARRDGLFPQTEEYDPSTDRWRRRADMSPPRHGTSPVAGGRTASDWWGCVGRGSSPGRTPGAGGWSPTIGSSSTGWSARSGTAGGGG